MFDLPSDLLRLKSPVHCDRQTEMRKRTLSLVEVVFVVERELELLGGFREIAIQQRFLAVFKMPSESRKPPSVTMPAQPRAFSLPA